MTVVAAIGTLCIFIMGLMITQVPGLPWWMILYLLGVCLVALLSLGILWKGATHD